MLSVALVGSVVNMIAVVCAVLLFCCSCSVNLFLWCWTLHQSSSHNGPSSSFLWILFCNKQVEHFDVWKALITLRREQTFVVFKKRFVSNISVHQYVTYLQCMQPQVWFYWWYLCPPPPSPWHKLGFILCAFKFPFTWVSVFYYL